MSAGSTRPRKSIAIVHAGEDTPMDDGYVPLRYGRLATELRARGDEVVRIGPTFSHFRRTQRSAGTHRSDEGTHVLVPTCSYNSSFDPQRARYFVQLVRGAMRELRARSNDLDAVVLGVPPPGVVTACRSAVGPDVGLLADVRDLWPEAFAVGRRKQFMAAAEVGGTILSQDLRGADAITAVTQPMLDWAPDVPAKRHVVPIGLQRKPIERDHLPPNDAPLQVCFLSNHSHGFDFVPVLEAWQQYCASIHNGHSASMGFIGCEPHTERERSLASNDATVRFHGRLAPDQVAATLSAYDIGLAPSTLEWAHSLGNKIFDYLAAGLYILHSIDPTAIAEVETRDLSRGCDRSTESWLTAFRELDAERSTLRSERETRIDRADASFGQRATAGALIDLIDQITS